MCEEFQSTAAHEAVMLFQEPAESMPESKKNEKTLMGLCVDCDNRNTCIFPKHEGGIWRCGEYL